MEAEVEKNLKEEAFCLELITKKFNILNVIQVTSVSFIYNFYKMYQTNMII